MKLAINILFFLIAVGLSYFLYLRILEPIEFEKEKKERMAVVVERLKEIRTAQIGYKDAKGKFAASWDSLVQAYLYDSIAVVKIIGNPDDSTTVTTFDTVFLPLMEHVFNKNVPIADFPKVPFNETERFKIDAGEIEKNKVKIQVFEVSVPESVLLVGMNPKYIRKNHSVQVGSMIEGTLSGNWE